MSFNSLILYVIFFVFLLFKLKEKKRHKLYVGILITYLLSAISGVYISQTVFSYMDKPIYTDAILVHIFLTFIILNSVKTIDDKAHESLQQPGNSYLLGIFTFIVVLMCSCAIFDSFRYISLDAILTNVNGLRNVMIDNSTIKEYSVLGYFVFWGKQLSSAALVLSFFYIIHSPSKKALIVVLLICSMTPLFTSFQYAAREYVLKYIIIFCGVYYLCKKQINAKWNKSLKKIILVSSIFSVSFFSLVTILRFENSYGFEGNSNSDLTNSVLVYLGQGFVNFSDVYGDFIYPKTVPGAINFPIFAGSTISKFNLNDVINSEVSLNSFPTTIGSWMIDMGLVLTIIVTLIYSCLFKTILRLRLNVYSLVYIAWIFDFMFSYIFFFNDVINTSRLVSILLVVLFDYFDRKITAVNYRSAS